MGCDHKSASKIRMMCFLASCIDELISTTSKGQRRAFVCGIICAEYCYHLISEWLVFLRSSCISHWFFSPVRETEAALPAAGEILYCSHRLLSRGRSLQERLPAAIDSTVPSPTGPCGYRVEVRTDEALDELL